MSTRTCRRCGGIGLVEPREGTDRVYIVPRMCGTCGGTGREKRNYYIGLVTADSRGKEDG